MWGFALKCVGRRDHGVEPKCGGGGENRGGGGCVGGGGSMGGGGGGGRGESRAEEGGVGKEGRTGG